MDDRGQRLSSQVFLRSGIEQSSTHALHQRAVLPLRFAVLLRLLRRCHLRRDAVVLELCLEVVGDALL